MGLDGIVRSAIATAAKVTGDLLCDVEHEAWMSQSSAGEPRYSGADTRQALVEFKPRLVKTNDGREILSTATVTFLAALEIDVRDRITLPNGQQTPIIAIEGLMDPTTGRPYATVVSLGG